MLDESRATEVCANTFLTASSDFFWETPELYEKSSTSDTLLRNSAQVDSDAGMPVCREPCGVVQRSEDEASEICGGFVCDGEEDLDAFMGYIDGVDDHLGPTTLVAVVDDTPFDHNTCKRRRSSEEVEAREEDEDEDEVESKFCKRQKLQEAAGTCQGSPDESSYGTGSGVTQPPGEDHTSGDDFCLDHSAEELQMLCDDFAFEMPEQECSSCSPEGERDSMSSGSARQSRRQKIRDTVKMLREAIPGGGCMDTAVVLDDAINYVKLLQFQVQALGAESFAQRAGR